MTHALVVTNERGGYRSTTWHRAACTCGASEASPRPRVTAAEAAAWHAAHVAKEQRHGVAS